MLVPNPLSRRSLWPWLAMLGVLLAAVYQLRQQGRLWVCACGIVRLWSGDVTSAENSQQLFDAYSFTHVQHGLVFYAVLTWTLPRVATLWRLWLAIAVEALWEVFENTAFVIDRYREATAARGYQGDSILNSVGDILVCGVGFMLARYLGWRRTLLLFVALEVLLIVSIRDSLLLNILMLLYPIDAIRQWQLGQ